MSAPVHDPCPCTTRARTGHETDLDLLIVAMRCNQKGVPLSYLYSYPGRAPSAGLAPPPVVDVIYLVGPTGFHPTVLYRDGHPIDPTEFEIFDGTWCVGLDLSAYCIVRFRHAQWDFEGRLYDRRGGDRITADLANPNCQARDVETRLSLVEERLNRFLLAEHRGETFDRFLDDVIDDARFGKLAKAIHEQVRRRDR